MFARAWLVVAYFRLRQDVDRDSGYREQFHIIL